MDKTNSEGRLSDTGRRDHGDANIIGEWYDEPHLHAKIITLDRDLSGIETDHAIPPICSWIEG